ncbi:response regulator transcription factor [Dyadobacter sp. 676]|uniref:Response regulator transcription factor n=1 Tax=Dyadobacter sp. 676 TaxID=3088362 RepID=A0AAU8FIM6_9BACT
MNFLVIDSHFPLRTGLSSLILQNFPSAQIDESKTIWSAIPLLESKEYDLIVTEINIDVSDCRHLIRVAKSRAAACRVLIYSKLNGELFAIPLMKNGADGFLSKSSGKDDIVTAIHTVLHGGKYLDVDLQLKLSANTESLTKNTSHNRSENLSGREASVMRLLLDGKSTKQIAYILGIKSNTVSSVKQRIYKKTSASNPLELYCRAQFLISH